VTRQIADSASSLGFSEPDHIIVGKYGYASLKGPKLI
jgi:DNA repair protein RadC